MHPSTSSPLRSLSPLARFTPWRCLAIAALALILGACATGQAAQPSVTMLSAAHYAPTQTVDVLTAEPQKPHQSIARLVLADASGGATRAQLVAQLTDTAKGLGANALVLENVDQSGTKQLAFNPSGGQMQGTDASVSLSVTALAIRYTP